MLKLNRRATHTHDIVTNIIAIFEMELRAYASAIKVQVQIDNIYTMYIYIYGLHMHIAKCVANWVMK